MSAESVALAHYRARKTLADALAAAARRAWARVDAADIARSWQAQLVDLIVLTNAAQLAAVQVADAYVDASLAEQGIGSAAEGRVVARSLAGVASDGRTLDTLLYRPVVATLAAVGQGAPVERALAGGLANLDMIVRTQVADMGRTADQVALTARRRTTGYVRMVVGKTCARCVVLAGKRYRWNDGFLRHPRCDCVHVPVAEDSADDVRTSPRGYFGSLTRVEQDQAFGRAGAEAIRNGADISQVVNARGGMYTAGGRQFTTTGTTRRGLAGQRLGGSARLMPEQIFREAGGDRDAAIRLLRMHGYIL